MIKKMAHTYEETLSLNNNERDTLSLLFLFFFKNSNVKSAIGTLYVLYFFLSLLYTSTRWKKCKIEGKRYKESAEDKSDETCAEKLSRRKQETRCGVVQVRVESSGEKR